MSDGPWTKAELMDAYKQMCGLHNTLSAAAGKLSVALTETREEVTRLRAENAELRRERDEAREAAKETAAALIREQSGNDGWRAAKEAGQLAGSAQQESEALRDENDSLRWALMQSEVPTNLYSGTAIEVARAGDQLRVDWTGCGWIRGILPDRIEDARAALEGKTEETER